MEMSSSGTCSTVPLPSDSAQAKNSNPSTSSKDAPVKTDGSSMIPLPTLEAAVEEPRVSRQLIVRNIGPSVTELELYKIFEEFGPIEAVKLNQSQKTGLSRGYGFVNFVNLVDATNAYKKMFKFELYGKVLRIGYSYPERILFGYVPPTQEAQAHAPMVATHKREM